MTQQNGSKVSPVALWLVVAGAGLSGVSGVGSLGQLNSLQTTMEEQVRVAEQRGKILARVDANRNLIDANSLRMDAMMPKEGIVRLHDGQQALIDKLIDWTSQAVTKSELQLAIKKVRVIQENR